MLRRSVCWLAWAAFAASLLAFLVGVALRSSYQSLWDDAYMFLRYADHLLGGEGMRWNVQDDAVYGLTSLAHLLAVIPARLAWPDNQHLPLMVAGWGVGIALLMVMASGVRRLGEGLRATDRLVLFAGLLYLFAVGGPEGGAHGTHVGVGFHLTTGMDTPMAMLAVAAWCVLLWRTNVQRVPSGVLLGAFGALVYLVRPDLVLLTLGSSAVLVLLASGRAARLGYLRVCVVGGVTLAAVAGVLWAWLGTPVPLPFFAKSTGLYDEETRALYDGRGWEELRTFLTIYAVPLGVIALHILVGPLRWVRELGRLRLAGLLTAVAFAVYYGWFVLMIMGGRQRFFYPLWPLVTLLGLASAAALFRRWSDGRALRVRSAVVAFAMFAIALHSAWVVVDRGGNLSRRIALNKAFQFPTAQEEIASGDEDADGASKHVRKFIRSSHGTWFTEQLSALPDDLVIAHTEVGYLSVSLPGKRLVDMAGLHDKDFARHGFSAERLLLEDQPDVLFFPLSIYQAMRGEITKHPQFTELYVRAKKGLPYPIYFRKQSPYIESLQATAHELLKRILASFKDVPARTGKRPRGS